MQTKINHALRTILLNYKEGMDETEKDKILLDEYIKLHDRTQDMLKQVPRLNYHYGELEDKIEEVEKVIPPVLQGIERLHAEAMKLSTDKDRNAHARNLHQRMADFFKQINELQEGILKELYAMLEGAERDYKEFKKEDNDILNGPYRNVLLTLNRIQKNPDEYAIDVDALEKDWDEMKVSYHSTEQFYDSRERIVKRYNKVMNNLTAGFSLWDQSKAELSKAYDDNGLMDRSISLSYKNGTGKASEKPIYLRAPDDPLIDSFAIDYGLVASSTMHTLNISVPFDIVKEKDTSYFHRLLEGMQHYPKLIEKYIFSIKINFTDDQDMDIPEEVWKSSPEYIRWFKALGSAPCGVFFLEDHDARGYFLMGDLLADGNLPTTDDGLVEFSGENLNLVCNNMFKACWFFHIYCHNTGFDPQPYIEALLAEFDLPVEYSQVRKQFEEDVAKGIKLKVVHKSKDEEKNEQGG
jgi:hypothetical protein